MYRIANSINEDVFLSNKDIEMTLFLKYNNNVSKFGSVNKK